MTHRFSPRPRIVIVGGGTAGLLLATRLGQQLGRKGRAQVTLIDRSLTHLWKPMLHTIAAGTRDVHQHKVSLLAQARAQGFAYEPGELCGLSRNCRLVHLAELPSAGDRPVVGPRAVPYDVLVLALGSGANDFGVPGVQAHCHFIDSQFQAEAFNHRLRWQLFRGALQDEAVTIDIVGAGATGVELAAELSHLMEMAAHFGDPTLRERLRLTLYESAPRILAAFPERVSESSHRVLEKLGFTIRTGTRVQAAQAQGLVTADQPLAPNDMTVWAAGIKAPEVLSRLGGCAPTPATNWSSTPPCAAWTMSTSLRWATAAPSPCPTSHAPCPPAPRWPCSKPPTWRATCPLGCSAAPCPLLSTATWAGWCHWAATGPTARWARRGCCRGNFWAEPWRAWATS